MQSNIPPYRRKRAFVSIVGTTQMHLRNPVIVALWSAVFPGFGHLLLSKYVSGFILIIWEIFINLKANLNLAIYHSMTGHFDMAIDALNIRWLLLYIPPYLFAIWDSYRSTVDMNNHFIVSVREDAEVKPFTVSALGFNYLDKSSPWVAVVWSMISPGMGQLAIHRILVAFFLLTWWIIVAYYSKLLPAITHTALFQFDLAKAVADKQWLLNIPSLFFFSLYDAYTNTVESNKLYEWEMAKYLKRDYQNKSFIMPVKCSQKRGKEMYVVSNFEYSINLEKAVTALQMKGIAKEDILAAPLDKRNESTQFLDKTHFSDSVSTVDFPIILAALFSLFGIIYGFVLHLGPILWALFGTAIGFFIGIAIKLITVRKKKTKKQKQNSEIVLIIACNNQQVEFVNSILWENGALGTSKISLN